MVDNIKGPSSSPLPGSTPYVVWCCGTYPGRTYFPCLDSRLGVWLNLASGKLADPIQKPENVYTIEFTLSASPAVIVRRSCPNWHANPEGRKKITWSRAIPGPTSLHEPTPVNLQTEEIKDRIIMPSGVLCHQVLGGLWSNINHFRKKNTCLSLVTYQLI